MGRKILLFLPFFPVFFLFCGTGIGFGVPCRMDYSKVITTLDLLSDNIRGMFDINNNMLIEGDNGGKND